VPEFLSDEWLAALDASARSIGPLPDVAPFVVEQLVTDVEGRGVVRYHLRFDDAGVHVRPGAADIADVTFATDAETAAEIARGETNAQRALAAGRFRVGGSIEALTTRSAAFSMLEDVFGAVRDSTTYPPRPRR
jgi:SCP-2 sterol transfer family